MIRMAIFNDHPCRDFNFAKIEGIIGGNETQSEPDEFVSYSLVRHGEDGSTKLYPISYCPFCGYQLIKQTAPQNSRFYPKIF